MTDRPGRRGSRVLARRLIVASPFAAMTVAFFCGSFDLTVGETLSHLAGWLSGEDSRQTLVLVEIRFPRILLAAMTGGVLAVSGSGLQAVLRNPLVDPFILGISSGAAFGCALSIAVLPRLPMTVSAFAFGCLATALSWALASAGRRGETSRLNLVLSGVVVSALFNALLSMIKFLAEPMKLQAIVFWLMGSFSLADWAAVRMVAVAGSLGLAPIIALRWQLNVASLGDREARLLGLDAARVRILVTAASALAVSTAVAASGIIGWVGLMSPHLTRLIVGPDHKSLVVCSMFLGAAFMVAADTLARSVSDYDFPVGVVTAVVGAPFFIYLMRRSQRGGG